LEKIPKALLLQAPNLRWLSGVLTIYEYHLIFPLNLLVSFIRFKIFPYHRQPSCLTYPAPLGPPFSSRNDQLWGIDNDATILCSAYVPLRFNCRYRFFRTDTKPISRPRQGHRGNRKESGLRGPSLMTSTQSKLIAPRHVKDSIKTIRSISPR